MSVILPSDQFIKPTIDDLIRDKRDIFEKLEKKSEQYIDLLTLFLSNLKPPDINIERLNLDNIDADTTLEIPPMPEDPNIDINFPELGTIPEFNETAPIFSALLELPDINIDNSEYTSEQLDLLLSTLTNYLSGDANFVDERLEEALFNRNRERDDLELQLKINQLKSEVEQFGYSYPDSVYLSNLTLLHREYMSKRLDASREALIKQIELQHDGKKFIIEVFSRLNSELMNFTKFIRELTFNASKAMADLTLAAFAEYVKKYNVDMDAFKTKAEVYIRQAQNIIDIYVKKISAEVSRIEAITKKYALQSDIVKTIIETQMKKIEAILRKYMLIGDVFKTNAEIEIKRAELSLNSMKTINDLRIEGYKLITTVLSQLAAGAIASISASVDAKYSFSEDNTPINY